MLARVRVGISGWTYEGWRGVFYPEKLPARRELEYASRQFESIEINGTFYSMQRPETFLRWYDETPEGFLFAIKGSRYITHFRRLREIGVPLANFLASGVLLLGEKLGPFLWQFPPQMTFDPEAFKRFLALLPRDTEQASRLARKMSPWMKERGSTHSPIARPLRHAVEIRNRGFAVPEFIELLRQNRIGLVVADAAHHWPYLEDVTADFVYVRLHGEKETYVSGYDEDALDRWAERVNVWSSGRQCPTRACVAPPWIDRRARRQGREVFVYFDNDAKVRAPFDALSLAYRVRTSDLKPRVENRG
ncbi:MAG: DUF72 domain-containing protein [Oligoflexia bacterium]|nr:DUF72 domain-containing protein [Oligoflexia bacterium]